MRSRAPWPSLQLIALLLVLWLALAGVDGWPMGLLAVGLALAASTRLAPMQFGRFSLSGLARFMAYFLVRSLAGGADVAWRALHPRMPLQVHHARFHLRLPPGQARSVFIGTVSLLPGTLARDLVGDTVMIHSIAGDPARELVQLERRIAGLFGLHLPARPDAGGLGE